MTRYVGVISGTSIDGLDIALLEDEPHLRIVAGETIELPENLQLELESLTQPGENELYRVGLAHVEFGDFIGESILEFLHRNGVQVNEVAAIGSHGQTVRHHPDARTGFSTQIGDGARIAKITGLPTVVDFRSGDIAANGQGAPLVPVFHLALFHSTACNRIIVNIGGIANVTFVTGDSENEVSGFDTGPGNALMDAWIRAVCNEKYDLNGQWSASGKVDSKLLEVLLADPYYTRPPPKSTGKEHFNLVYLQQTLSTLPELSPRDVQATLCELTAQTIHDAVTNSCVEKGELIVCGGGRLNVALLQRLQDVATDYSVFACDSLGVNGDAIEAAAFAYLAKLRLEQKPGNVLSATGANSPRVLGAIYN